MTITLGRFLSVEPRLVRRSQIGDARKDLAEAAGLRVIEVAEFGFAAAHDPRIEVAGDFDVQLFAKAVNLALDPPQILTARIAGDFLVVVRVEWRLCQNDAHASVLEVL